MIRRTENKKRGKDFMDFDTNYLSNTSHKPIHFYLGTLIPKVHSFSLL